MSEKILVTIANYNHEDYLEKSILSIVEQTYENLDICIIDDFSNNQTAVDNIVSQFNDNRIRYIKNKKNMGKWWCLNYAIKTTNATICTSHDADDISLSNRIENQYAVLKETRSLHNLCSFYHCWNQKDIDNILKLYNKNEKLEFIDKKTVYDNVIAGFSSPGINHYYTGQIETAGTSAMFYKQIWDLGIRFNPPHQNLRVLTSEDSDFNFRCTSLLNNTTITLNKMYCYRRNTSTNREEV